MKEIQEKAKAYAFDNDGFGYDLNTCEDIFTDGAEWVEEQMIAKAVKWLSYWYNEDTQSYMTKEDIDDFKKAMER